MIVTKTHPRLISSLASQDGIPLGNNAFADIVELRPPCHGELSFEGRDRDRHPGRSCDKESRVVVAQLIDKEHRRPNSIARSPESKAGSFLRALEDSMPTSAWL